MCVLELELLSGDIEMAFIVSMQFNFGYANAFVGKGFLCNFTFIFLLLIDEELRILSPWLHLLCFLYFLLFLFKIFSFLHKIFC